MTPASERELSPPSSGGVADDGQRDRGGAATFAGIAARSLTGVGLVAAYVFFLTWLGLSLIQLAVTVWERL